VAGVLAWRLPGCRDVINGLEVDPLEEDGDDKIAQAVDLVLGQTDPVRTRSIRIEVKGGVVYVAGRVSVDLARAIERDIWTIFGVDQVVSSLRPNRAPSRAGDRSPGRTPLPR
jgi:osmotically-inducible protein OsmY